MSATAPRFLPYRCAGHDEIMLARGPDVGPRLLLLPPLFEEMNRCRALLADVQRGLAAAGIASVLPDLPGTGESERALETVTLDDWREAASAAAAAFGATAVAALRGGCLLDDRLALPRWRLAPADGGALLRDLDRADTITGMRGDASLIRGGYPISTALAEGLAVARPTGEARVVRLASDPAPADGRMAGVALWRRAEPDRDAALAAAMLADLSAWIASCAG